MAGIRDVKELVIAGCRVQLAYNRVGRGGWSVRGTVHCGIGANRSTQALTTAAYRTRAAAEQEAIRRASALLGHNQVDRSHSRVTNWE